MAVINGATSFSEIINTVRTGFFSVIKVRPFCVLFRREFLSNNFVRSRGSFPQSLWSLPRSICLWRCVSHVSRSTSTSLISLPASLQLWVPFFNGIQFVLGVSSMTTIFVSSPESHLHLTPDLLQLQGESNASRRRQEGEGPRRWTFSVNSYSTRHAPHVLQRCSRRFISCIPPIYYIPTKALPPWLSSVRLRNLATPEPLHTHPDSAGVLGGT